MSEVSVTTEGVTVLEAQALRWRAFRGFVRGIAKECDDARRSSESSQCFVDEESRTRMRVGRGRVTVPENVIPVSSLARMLRYYPLTHYFPLC